MSFDVPRSGVMGLSHFAVVVHVRPLAQRDRLRGVIVYIPYIVFSSITILTSLFAACWLRAIRESRYGLVGCGVGR